MSSEQPERRRYRFALAAVYEIDVDIKRDGAVIHLQKMRGVVYQRQ
jgi:hypothetical protein